jgi:hypothetical protein
MRPPVITLDAETATDMRGCIERMLKSREALQATLPSFPKHQHVNRLIDDMLKIAPKNKFETYHRALEDQTLTHNQVKQLMKLSQEMEDLDVPGKIAAAGRKDMESGVAASETDLYRHDYIAGPTAAFHSSAYALVRLLKNHLTEAGLTHLLPHHGPESGPGR